jgi:nucleotide-binding universal stress UspA family protein
VTSTHGKSTGPIVVGVDGSPSSLAALDWAARQGELTGSSLELVMAWEWPTTYGAPFMFATDWNPAQDAAKVLDSAVATVRAAHPGVDIHSTVVEGHPAVALVAASKGAQLLVVGSRGHGEFAGMLLGSVSEHCVTNANCPVLVLRDDK